MPGCAHADCWTLVSLPRFFFREDRETALPKPTAGTANGQPVAADALLGDSLTGVIPVPAISNKVPGTIECATRSLRACNPRSSSSATFRSIR